MEFYIQYKLFIVMNIKCRLKLVFVVVDLFLKSKRLKGPTRPLRPEKYKLRRVYFQGSGVNFINVKPQRLSTKHQGFQFHEIILAFGMTKSEAFIAKIGVLFYNLNCYETIMFG